MYTKYKTNKIGIAL